MNENLERCFKQPHRSRFLSLQEIIQLLKNGNLLQHGTERVRWMS